MKRVTLNEAKTKQKCPKCGWTMVKKFHNAEVWYCPGCHYIKEVNNAYKKT